MLVPLDLIPLESLCCFSQDQGYILVFVQSFTRQISQYTIYSNQNNAAIYLQGKGIAQRNAMYLQISRKFCLVVIFNALAGSFWKSRKKDLVPKCTLPKQIFEIKTSQITFSKILSLLWSYIYLPTDALNIILRMGCSSYPK